jgi:hypothetical protein
MINKDNFVVYLSLKFPSQQLDIDKFKPELWFVEIDCFSNQSYKLAIEISTSDIKISTVNKNPSLDFSLYDYVFAENKEAEDFIDKVFLKQEFPHYL